MSAPSTDPDGHDPCGATTFLFTDIEGSTRLWEQEPERMRLALACHDALTRRAVEDHRGLVVKTLGDGLHAAFDDPLDAVAAALQMQLALANPEATGGMPLKIRCGIHMGVIERRDSDFFGSVVNRAARIMSVAHGGQVLVSQAVASHVGGELPAGVVLRDLGAVRLRNVSSPERVYQVVHPQLRQDFPALRSLEATPNNLPHQATSFVGREHELAEAKQLLKNCRLLTLLGAGGIGKTRLSLQMAADVIDDYPDGAWFVELAPLTDACRVAQAVASVVGVKEEAGRPVLEALVKYVKDRQLLLILDNCEHLVDACAQVVTELLQAGPGLKVLTSSREPLRVRAESTYAVPTLAVPDACATIASDSVEQYEAVRLFVSRATAVQPAFRVTAQNAAWIADICRRLDGIPLALELAAARVRTLSVEKIAERLSDRFRLLVEGDRTALPRQQTLRALIDWSHDLLSEPERALFRRLAVFAGGWTLEAAEAVGAGNGLDEADVLDVLGHLVDKSLVESDSTRERYRLLDTVREYAQTRLTESGEGERTRTRHLAHYLATAEKARPGLAGPEQGAWLARLDLERENLLAAHAWCDRAEDGAALGLRLSFAVKPYWFFRGLLALGLRVTVEALARPGAHERNIARSRGLFGAGQFCCFMGRYQEAKSYLEECLAIGRELGDKAEVAAALQPLVVAAFALGDGAGARRYAEEAVALAQELGDRRELAGALNGLAQLHRAAGSFGAAEPLYARVLALARELGDQENIAIALLNLAMVAIGRGTFDGARRMLVEVHAIVDEIGSKPAGQSVLEVSAGLAAAGGEWARAARFYGAAESLARQTGLQRDPTDEAFLVPLIGKARDMLCAAAFAAEEDAGRVLTYDDAMAQARAWLERRA